MTKKILFYWLPPLALMSVIFYLSSRQQIAVGDVYTVNFIIFKSLHIIEYALLFFLIFRAFYATTKLPLNAIFALAIVISILYGISDELHQTFVPTRQGSIRDVFIDTLGILLMFSYTKNNLSKLKRFL